MKELIVKCGSRESLEEALTSLGGLVGSEIAPNIFTVRAFPPEKHNFIKFAIEKQGYGKLIEEREI